MPMCQAAAAPWTLDRQLAACGADALALANSVALKLGRAAEGCPRAAELLRAASAQEAATRRKVCAGHRVHVRFGGLRLDGSRRDGA